MADGSLNVDLECLEIEPVEIQGGRDPGVGVVHGTHGHKSREKKGEIIGAFDADAPAEAESKGDKIDYRYDHGGKDIAEFEEPPFEMKHFL
jgi:hypothetical protein